MAKKDKPLIAKLIAFSANLMKEFMFTLSKSPKGNPNSKPPAPQAKPVIMKESEIPSVPYDMYESPQEVVILVPLG
ncbi:MAG: hypothetical protein IJL24_02635 [Treponema sp.]|nr:hypothetical protein [Treponema sp.]